MSDVQFVDGLIVKAPHKKAPEFVKMSISIKREELLAWLESQQGEWINLDVKESRSGKWYAAVNEWQKDGAKADQSHPSGKGGRSGNDGGFIDDDIPF